jgi:hypothetical protein
MYKTPTFAEPQQCNRPFSTGQLSAFIIQLVTWQVSDYFFSSTKIRISFQQHWESEYFLEIKP